LRRFACGRVQARGDEEAALYRFTWNSSFNGDAVMRIGRQGDEIALRWAYRRFRPRGVDARSAVSPTTAKQGRIQDALIAAARTV